VSDAIVMLHRVAEGTPNYLGIEVFEVPCDDCGEPCWRSKTTPTVHLEPDGTVMPVRSICTHCIAPYLTSEQIQPQPMTQEQRDELLASAADDPRARAIIERIIADPEFRGTMSDLLLRFSAWEAEQ
jgi:hypothetical protein